MSDSSQGPGWWIASDGKCRQLAQLYSMIREVNRPHIVAGDFNSLWGEDEIGLFLGATGLLDANLESEPTFPSWKPNRHLDFVLHSPDIEVNKFWIPDVQLSDHLPLVIDFEVNREKIENVSVRNNQTLG